MLLARGVVLLVNDGQRELFFYQGTHQRLPGSSLSGGTLLD